jgi:hydroxymethylbilane synthase
VAEPIRGNVDTRLAAVADRRLDAVIVAQAGLARLGRLAEVTETLDAAVMLPAPAQGALAVECRDDNAPLIDALSTLDDHLAHAAVAAERALLAGLAAGCSAPVAGLAEVVQRSGGGLDICLSGAVFSPDGRVALRQSGTGFMPTDRPALQAGTAFLAAEQVGRDLAAALLAAGADTVMGVPHDPHP